MVGKRFVVGLLSPLHSVKGQNPKLYLTTTDELNSFTGGIITLWVKDTANIRYVRGWEEIEVIKIDSIEEIDGKGIEQVVDTRSKGLIKVIYTTLELRVIYAKSKNTCKEEKRHYYRGYYVDTIKNFGLVTKDGYIPLDKDIGLGNTRILKHNKRKLIKRGAGYIHNDLECIMGFVDKVYHTDVDMINDNSRINLGSFIDNLLL